jgi:hypothetical protein
MLLLTSMLVLVSFWLLVFLMLLLLVLISVWLANYSADFIIFLRVRLVKVMTMADIHVKLKLQSCDGR